MKRTQKWIIGTGLTISLGIAAAAAYAHGGSMGGGMGMGSGMQSGSGGMQHGAMQHGSQGPQGSQEAMQLMTPEERNATMEKMRSAKTPQERQQIVATTRAEMDKRAKEKGITLPAQRGPGFGPGAQTGPNEEHKH